MAQNPFKPVPFAPNYQISLKGDLMNAKGFPIQPVDGKVRLTTAEGRKFYTIPQLVKATYGVDMPASTSSAPVPDLDLDITVPTAAIPAPQAVTLEGADIAAKIPPVGPPMTKKQFKAKVASGTPEENAKWKQRLDFDIANVIRTRVAGGEKKSDLAKEYGVQEQTIYDIVRFRIWKVADPRAKKAPQA
jgi:hypothetical protein